MCAAATVPNCALVVVNTLVDPNPTTPTFNISSLICSKVFVLIDVIPVSVTVVDPIPTSVESPVETFLRKSGLWITLSIVIKALVFATLVSTDKVCVVPGAGMVSDGDGDRNVKNVLLIVASVLIPESLIVLSSTL